MARPSAAEARKRERDAFDMRQSGKTFEEIAEELGFRDRSSAHKAYQRAIVAAKAEVGELDEDRLLELARLDRLYAVHFGKALEGDLQHSAQCLKISERRERIRGLAVPPAGAQSSAAPTGGDPVDDLAARRTQRLTAS